VKYLLIHCLDETAELSPEDDDDVEDSAAALAVAAWDSEMGVRGSWHPTAKIGTFGLRPIWPG
jgi:hypothetical protein